MLLQLEGSIEMNNYADAVGIEAQGQDHSEGEDFVVTGWGTLSVSILFATYHTNMSVFTVSRYLNHNFCFNF